MSHFFASLRVRLALLVLLAVLPALGIILYTGLEQRRQLAANAQDEALILVKHSCADFENVIQTTSQVLALLAQCPSVQLQDWHACAMMLADLLRKHPGYFNLGVVDRHGNLVCSAVPFTGALNMANFAWFMRVRETLDFSLGDLQIGPVIGKPTMHCGYPVLDRDGEMQVAVFAALDLNWLRRLVPMTSLPPGSVFAIIDREGHIMVRYPNPEAWVGKKTAEAEATQVILAQRQGVAEAQGVDGVSRLYAFAPLGALPHGGGYIYVGISAAAVYAPVTRVLVRNLVGLGLAAALALACSLGLGHLLVTRGMNVLVRTARRVTAGGLEARTGLSCQGEIGQLARTLDEMAAALEQRQEEHRRAQEELEKTNKYLENVFAESADGIGIVDQHGRFIKWNKAAVELYGYTMDELRQKSAFELYEDRDELKKMLAQLGRDGYVRNYEINMRRKDGRICPFALSIRLLRDDDNRVFGSVTVARDLTEVKQAMARMEAMNDRLQAEIGERRQAEAALNKALQKLQGTVAETEERNRSITLLNEMSEFLQACQSCQEAHAACTHFGPRFFPEAAGTLYMLNSSKILFEAVGTWGAAAADGFAPEECWSIRRGRVHLVAGPGAELLCPHAAGPSDAASLCVPLLAQGEAMGVLHLRISGDDGPLPEGALEAKGRLAVTLAEHLAMALANLKLQETLRHQALRDPLTGLFNRRYLEETLVRELHRAQRLGTPVGIIMMDLDRFKQFNDSHGHHAGDALLEALGSLIQAQVRLEDIACRYGGEEFLLLLPGAPLQTTRERAEKLRRAVKGLRLKYRGQSLQSPTISAGVAAFPEYGGSGEEVIMAADEALYQAKHEGKDRVVVAAPRP